MNKLSRTSNPDDQFSKGYKKCIAMQMSTKHDIIAEKYFSVIEKRSSRCHEKY